MGRSALNFYGRGILSVFGHFLGRGIFLLFLLFLLYAAEFFTGRFSVCWAWNLGGALRIFLFLGILKAWLVTVVFFAREALYSAWLGVGGGGCSADWGNENCGDCE